MSSLIGEPHEEGLQILKDELFEKIKKFALVDDSDKIYYESEVHSVGSDADGVLVVVVTIPIEEHFTKWNKSLYLLSDDNKKITVIQTPSIQFVKGVGGEQVIKLTVSAEPSQLFFKADDYLTDFEFKNKIESYGVDLTNGVFNAPNAINLNGETSKEIKLFSSNELFLPQAKTKDILDLHYKISGDYGKINISIVEDVNTNIEWTKRSEIAKEFLGAMGKKDGRYIYDNFQILSFKWSDITGTSAYLPHVHVPLSLNGVTIWSVAKLISGDIGNAGRYLKGVTNKASVCGEFLTASDRTDYIGTHPVLNTGHGTSQDGEVYVALITHQFGKMSFDLAGITKNYNDFSYFYPTSLNGWVNDSGIYLPKVEKLNNVVRITGYVKNGNSGTSLLYKLPAKYRSKKHLTFICSKYASSTDNSIQLRLQTTGELEVLDYAGSGWIVLDISYNVEG